MANPGMAPGENRFSISRSGLAAFHVIACSVGLLGLVLPLAKAVAIELVARTTTFIQYAPWVAEAMERGDLSSKPSELLFYLLGAAILFPYYFVMFRLINRSSARWSETGVFARVTQGSWRGCLAYVGAVLAFNAAVFWIVQRAAPYRFPTLLYGLSAFAWVYVAGAPGFPAMEPSLDWLAGKKGRMAATVLLVLLVGHVVAIFVPFVGPGGLPVANDYFDIPETTILRDGRVVDNTSYINAHRVGGMLKFDPRKSPGEQFKDSVYAIPVKTTPLLSQLVKLNRQALSIDLEGQEIIVKGWITPELRDDLLRIASDGREREAIENAYLENRLRTLEKRIYSPEEREFVAANLREMRHQLMAGYYFHHHHVYLGGMNEYLLGKPRDRIATQYGHLCTIVTAWVIDRLGGFNFGNYIRVLYAFYPLYYVLYVVVAALILRDAWYVLLVTVACYGSLQLVGFEHIRFASGFNPVRHFLDLLVLAAFHGYLFARRGRLPFLALSLFLASISTLWCREFGLPLMAALVCTVIIRNLSIPKKSAAEFFVVLLGAASTILGFLLVRTTHNSSMLYTLLGVSVPGTGYGGIFLLLLAIGGGLAVLWLGGRVEERWRTSYLLLFLYSQGVLLYWVWNPDISHLATHSGIVALTLAVLLKRFSFSENGEVLVRRIVIASTGIFLTLFYVPSLFLYYVDRSKYERVFQTHVVHSWDFPTARFKSTMDPQPFANAVGLIHKYSGTPEIYIVSKYDNFLPFLAQRYSAMPFSSLALSLVTEREMQAAERAILDDRPGYMFVDSDIERSHAGDILDPEDPVARALGADVVSRGRARVLDNLGTLFERVRDCYEIVERGDLITVYKRKP